MELLIDDRERNVVPFFEDHAHKYNINYRIQRLQVGDYAITQNGRILLIIERKTWEDLAASLRDGRKDNVQKMLNVRHECGCSLAYIIEGDPTPKFDAEFSRMPVNALRAHLDHLMMRDGVFIMYSKNEEYTAQRLLELSRNCVGLIKNGGNDQQTPDKQAPNQQSNLDQQTLDKQAPNQQPSINNPDQQPNQDQQPSNTNLLTKKQESQICIAEQMLRCIPGVGSVISALLSKNDITLYKIYHKEITPDSVALLEYNTGAMIGLERAQKIFTNVERLIDTNFMAKTKIVLLYTIPMISKATAKAILGKYTLKQIFNNQVSLAELANLEKGKKKLGNKAAQNVLKYLSQVLKMSHLNQESKPSDEITQESKPVNQSADEITQESKPINQSGQEAKIDQLRQQKPPLTKKSKYKKMSALDIMDLI